MPKRDWSGVTAFGVIAVVCIGFAIGLWAGGNQYADQADNQSRTGTYEAQPDLSLLSEETKGAQGYQAICNHPINREYADLCQQWRSAESASQSAGYAQVQMWLSGAGLLGLATTVILSAVAAFASIGANKAATSAAVTAEKTYLTDNRPWLPLKGTLARPSVITDKHITFHLSLTAPLIGTTPAIGVRFQTMPHPGLGTLWTKEWIKTVIEIMDRPGAEAFELIVGPSDKFEVEVPIVLEIEDAKRIHIGQEFQYVIIVVCGISYRSLIDETRRYSVVTLLITLRTTLDGKVDEQSSFYMPGGSLMT